MHPILSFCQGLPAQTYAAGEILFAESEKTDMLYILIDGRVEILKGQVQVHVASEPGAVFGEISALLDIPHTASVKTLAPSRAYVVGNASEFLNSHQDMALLLSKLLAQRLHGVTTYLADLKTQFEDRLDHMGMVDEVLETLLHQQDEEFLPGSDRHPDPTI